MRGEHAQYNGTVRAWNDAPDPGEDYNCRCWAEAVEPGLNSVYPELTMIAGYKALQISRLFAEKIIRTIKRKPPAYDKYTEHGKLRIQQRKISQNDIDTAIKTAKEKGNVTIKTGKYGTPQIHYKGLNGITVIEETSGKNAGKVITTYRH